MKSIKLTRNINHKRCIYPQEVCWIYTEKVNIEVVSGEQSEESGDINGDGNECDHLAFIFNGVIRQFTYQSSDFQKRINNIKDDDLFHDNFIGYLEEAGYDNNLLALEITFGGLGHGPNWNSIICGYDYGTLIAD